MTHRVFSMREGYRTLFARQRAGFTAIELLVVVAVVALAASMLAPLLARVREGERTRVCLNNLKQLGGGISRYVEDNDGVLPGPMSLAIQWNSAHRYLPHDTDSQRYYRRQLSSFIEPYIGPPAVGGPRPADLIAVCPTADGIEVADRTNMGWAYGSRPYYVANTGAGSGTDPGNAAVKYRTNPPDYFGNPPKRLDTIANQSTEWAVADLWYWSASAPFSGARPVGTWPFVLTGYTTSVINLPQLAVPSYPFHLTLRTFSPTGTDHTTGTPRLTSGKTNAVYFDGHAASVGPWTGTVNPAF